MSNRFEIHHPFRLAAIPALLVVIAGLEWLRQPGSTGPITILLVLVLFTVWVLWRWHRLARSHRETVRAWQERSTYLEALIEHSPLAIVVLDPRHRVQLVNPAFEALFGWSAEEVVGSDLDGIIATGIQAEEAEAITHSVLSGDSIHKTARRWRKDGELIDVEIHGVPLSIDGEALGVFALYQDVTRRRQAERGLRDSEERFRLLSEATFEGLVITERGRIVDCNEQFARLLRRPGEVLEGTLVEDFVVPADRERVRHKMTIGYELPYEHRAICGDGEVVEVEVHGRSIPFQDRTLRVAAVRDITERKRLEEEVRQAQKMEAVGRLAGGIAHDFNNILTVVSGYSQLLALGLDEPSLASHVGEIRKATDHARAITQRLLTFSRKRPSQALEIELGDALQGVESMVRRLVPADIDLDWDLAPEPQWVRVDPTQIEQMVINLAINAADAMPGGGTLGLATRIRELSRENYPTLEPGPYVELEVRDTGSGMDEATRAQAFEPFFTTKEHGQGTGLGLATVYGIVRQNGGGIHLESTPGEGTSFRIVLPRVSGPRSAPISEQRERSESSTPAAPATVLVVEDEAGVRNIVTSFLRLEGFEILEAERGDHALELLGGHPEIAAVVSDVVMPGINGPQLVARARCERPNLPVLYMSGYADEIVRQRGALEGDPLLRKPFSREQLVSAIRRLLPASGRR